MKSRLVFYLLLGLSLHNGPATAEEEATDGTLKFKILDLQRRAVPGKLLFFRNGRPVNLKVVSTGLLACRENVVYTASGSGELQIPAGEYDIRAEHGLEYSVSTQKVQVPAGKTTAVQFTLQRVVDTGGYIAADLHLHTEFSREGDTTVEERLISGIGEGLEWIVATDHNYITDYDTIRTRLGLGEKIVTTAGNEVSTDFGHFNIFPLQPGSGPISTNIKGANTLFRIIRALPTEPIIQVNHPRWTSSVYFESMNLDPLFATTTDSSFSFDFDAMEVLNEDLGVGWRTGVPSQVSLKQDWFNLLNSGYRVTAVGNSNSHDLTEVPPGFPRNYIASKTEKPGEISEAELIESVRQGNVSVSRGIYLNFHADGKPMGSFVGMKNGKVTFTVRVQAPARVHCDTLQLIESGQLVHNFLIEDDEDAERFKADITLSPRADTWYIVVASGSKPFRMGAGFSKPVLPLGFSNPIWVDADGDGKFTSLKERAAHIVDSNLDDIPAMRAALTQDRKLLPFAISYVGTSNIPAKSKLLARFIRNVDENLRSGAYQFLSIDPDPIAIRALQGASRRAESDEERTAISVARVKAGEPEQWQEALATAMQTPNKHSLKTMFKGFPVLFFTNWRIAAPFLHEDSDIIDTVFDPERDSNLTNIYESGNTSRIAWQNKKAAADGTFDLVSLYGSYDYANAYAVTKFKSRASGLMLFRLASDDGAVLWLNDEEVHRNHVHRGLRPEYDLLILPVAEGENTILLKIENRTGEWGFMFKAVDVLGWIE